MVSKDIRNAKLLFRVGLAASFVSICLSAYIIARAQTGPGWEVPVAVMEELRTIPPVSMGFALFSLILYLWGNRSAAMIGPAARTGFLVALLLAFAFYFIVSILAPEQWPFQYVVLSSCSAFVPRQRFGCACGTCFGCTLLADWVAMGEGWVR